MPGLGTGRRDVATGELRIRQCPCRRWQELSILSGGREIEDIVSYELATFLILFSFAKRRR